MQELVLEIRRVTIPRFIRCVGVVHTSVEKLYVKNWSTCRARFVPRWNVSTRATRARYSAVLRDCAERSLWFGGMKNVWRLIKCAGERLACWTRFVCIGCLYCKLVNSANSNDKRDRSNVRQKFKLIKPTVHQRAGICEAAELWMGQSVSKLHTAAPNR
jgi:hypothetical protein